MFQTELVEKIKTQFHEQNVSRKLCRL